LCIAGLVHLGRLGVAGSNKHSDYDSMQSFEVWF